VGARARPLEPLEIGHWSIRLTDLARDLEGLDPRSPTAHFVAATLVSLALEAYFALTCIWPEKPQRVIDRLCACNVTLGAKVIAFYETAGPQSTLAIEIADAVLAPAGGRLVEYTGPHIECVPNVESQTE
jgi:hypothetical protein